MLKPEDSLSGDRCLQAALCPSLDLGRPVALPGFPTVRVLVIRTHIGIHLMPFKTSWLHVRTQIGVDESHNLSLPMGLL